MAKQVIHGEESRAAILRGVNQLRGRCESHAWPQGPQRRYRQKFGSPTITKDGVTVAKEIELKDTLENMGARWFAKSPRKPATSPVTARRRRRCSRRRSSKKASARWPRVQTRWH